MQIRIFHTNDIHSNYEFLKKVHAYLRDNKTADDLYFDSGDYADLKNLIVQADKGRSAAELIMSCGLDGMAVGNNEVDMGYDAVSALAHNALPLIAANVTDADDAPVEYLPASAIYKRCGLRILVIGLGPYYREYKVPSGYNVFAAMGNLKFHAPEERIREELNKNRGKYDFCILLSHSGLSVEKELMRQFDEINLCLGGHSHDTVNYAGYTQSGMGEYLGEITLEVDENGIFETGNRLIELSDCGNPEFDRMLWDKQKLADEIMAEELDAIAELSFDAFTECPLINFVCDCLLSRYGGNLAVMHNGIAEHALTRPVSKKSLLETFPSKLNPTIYSITGDKIVEAVRLSFDAEHTADSGNGPGFRGKVLGTLGFSSNVRITKEPFSVTVDGAPIELQKEYVIVTDDYLQRGTGYPSLRVPNSECRYDKWFIRDLVENHLTDVDAYRSAAIMRCR